MKKIIFLFIGLFFLVSCSSDTADEPMIRVGYFPNVTHAQALIIKDQEEQSDTGGSIEFKTFNAGSSAIEALFSNHIDLAYIGPIPAINAHVKSRGEFVIIAGGASSGAHLIASKKSGIQTVDDLDGKRVSIPQRGNTQHIDLVEKINQHHLYETYLGGSVDIIPLPNNAVREYMKKGEIDAAFLIEPWVSEILMAEEAIMVFSEKWSQDFVDQTTAVILINKEYLEENPEEVSAYLKKHIQATTFIQENSGEASEIISQQIEVITGVKIKTEDVEQSLKDIQFSVLPHEESLMAYQELFYQRGFIGQTVLYSDLVDLSILKLELLSDDVD